MYGLTVLGFTVDEKLLRKERQLPGFICAARTVEGDFRFVRDMSPKVG